MKDSANQDIPGLISDQPTTSLTIQPAIGREEPGLWIRKLGVYKEWPPTSDSLMRQVLEFRRGLNIVWALPNGASSLTARLSGHGAGKTTLCRLIRYVLGEQPAGSVAFRNAFRAKFGYGWVLAEVVIAGKEWLVGRPLSDRGLRSFAFLGGSFNGTQFDADTPPKVGFRELFLPAVEDSVFGSMKIRILADSQEKLDWARLLPWLTRDQEAHFGGLLHWRHKLDSDSNSPEVSATDKVHLIRLVLGLIDEEEQGLRDEYAKVTREHEQKLRTRTHYEFAVERARKSLQAEFQIEGVNPEDVLLAQLMIQKVEMLRKAYRESSETLARKAKINKLTTDLVDKSATRQNVESSIAQLKEHLAVIEARIQSVTPPPKKQEEANEPNRNWLAKLGPRHGYCGQPINNAWRERCPLATGGSDEFSSGFDKVVKTDAERDRQLLESGKLELVPQESRLAVIKAAIETIERSIAEEEKSLKSDEENNAYSVRAIDLEVLFRSFKTGSDELQRLDELLSDLKIKTEDLKAKLDSANRSRQAILGQFSDIFDKLAQHLLGPAVSGHIKFGAKSINPVIQYDGDRDSAAFKVVRWLAFDLASLAMGMVNPDTFHPRFLIHDSPRESDLAASIYSALFTAAHLLEKGCSQEPAFQYIVTTTEPPPEELRKSPWLITPVLDASLERGRLLGVNL